MTGYRYAINCGNVTFMSCRYDEAMEILEEHGSWGSCIIDNRIQDVVMTWEMNEYGITMDEMITSIMERKPGVMC